ncbi:hypothetical protein R1sor_011849 [Riccia sorocarpa]|uniref:Endonuclease/exonuclease/phosphatase domain-containing protein n=1 Tax=Riccia sorocarpa TaxID=122646 RepID=A0ABD3I255_9MARC
MWKCVQENSLFENDSEHLSSGVIGRKRDSSRRSSIVTRSLEFPDGKKKACDRPDSLAGVEEHMANTNGKTSAEYEVTTGKANLQMNLGTTSYTQPGARMEGSPRRTSSTSDIQTQMLLGELERNNVVIRQILANQVGLAMSSPKDEKGKSTTTSSEDEADNAAEAEKSPVGQQTGSTPDASSAGADSSPGDQTTSVTPPGKKASSLQPGVSYAAAANPAQSQARPQHHQGQSPTPAAQQQAKGDRKLVAEALNRMPQPTERTNPKKCIHWELSGEEADEVGRRVQILESRALIIHTGMANPKRDVMVKWVQDQLGSGMVPTRNAFDLLENESDSDDEMILTEELTESPAHKSTPVPDLNNSLGVHTTSTDMDSTSSQQRQGEPSSPTKTPTQTPGSPQAKTKPKGSGRKGKKQQEAAVSKQRESSESKEEGDNEQFSPTQIGVDKASPIAGKLWAGDEAEEMTNNPRSNEGSNNAEEDQIGSQYTPKKKDYSQRNNVKTQGSKQKYEAIVEEKMIKEADLSMVSWNLNGLGCNDKVKAVQDWLNSEGKQAKIIAIQELKAGERVLEFNIRRLKMDAVCIVDYSSTDRGGAGLILDKSLHVTSTSIRGNGSVAWAKLQINGEEIRVASIYGPHDLEGKIQMMDWIRESNLADGGKWLIGGDWNMVLYEEDSAGPKVCCC